MGLGCTFGEGRPQLGGCAARRSCYCALLHDLMVVYRVPDVDVCLEGYVRHGWVEVEDIRGRRGCFCMQMSIYTLHEGGLSGASHSDSDNTNWFLHGGGEA